MSKILTFLILLFSINASAISFSEIDSLIKNQQYLSAWNSLTKLEKSKDGVNAHLKKIELSLKYFTKTFSHKLFSFTDLKKGQNLVKIRVASEKKTMKMFPYEISSIIDSLQKTHPTDYRLKKIQGDFYYDVSILYGNDWVLNKQEVTRRMYEGYSKAEEYGIVDHISLYALGYFWNINNDHKKSANYFNRSLLLDSTYAPTHYNLAYIYSEKDSLEKALHHAWQAYHLYTYIDYKNDAGQMAGSILGKLDRHEEAISLLLDVDRLIPNTYYTLYYLLNSFLATEKITESQITAKNMFNMDWKSHTINADIIKLFVNNNQMDILEQFYKNRLEEEKFDKEYSGYIYLHLGQAFQMADKVEEALINISLAEESFNICYDPGHPVFSVIEKMKR
jgi:tetratricopeptide (TPR) repeat protein